ncbi:MAG: 50S ribosomal protein L4 [Segetibacter sp.]
MATTKSTTQPTLPPSIFALKVENHELLKLAYDSYLANNRLASATTKQRGEVRGGGKKPWQQKGTGRARFGSSRNPIWRGGGIVFGPRGNENYRKSINVASKRQALKQALSLANQSKKIIVSTIKTTGKTKEVADCLGKLGVTRRCLIVVDVKTPELARACHNLPQVHLISAMYLTVYHVLNADHIIVNSASIGVIEKWLGTNQKGRS